MPVFTPIHVLKRSDDYSTISNPIYIAGIVVVGVIALGVGLWLSLRVYRKRAMRKRQENMGAAFFSVKGLVPEGGDPEKKDGSLQRSMTQIKGFSRNNLDASIVLPEKALARAGGAATRDEIINYHARAGALPKPFSFALSGSPRTSTLDPGPRASFVSSATEKRFSVMSSVSSIGSSTSGSLRKVRQLFDPVLPDELLVSLGDQLTVVQSFDDGWCVVGRESEFAGLVQSAKSLFGNNKASSQQQQGSNVELGVVPAWCFLRPVKGLRAERPVRSSSLGITVQMDGPGFSSRNELTSWSNF